MRKLSIRKLARQESEEGRLNLRTRTRSSSASSRRSKDRSVTNTWAWTTGPEAAVDVEWYPSWLDHHRTRLAHVAAGVQFGGHAVSDLAGFSALHGRIEEYARANRGFSIDDLIDDLRGEGGLAEDPQALGAQRVIVFALLGWLSMVYTPALNTLPLSSLGIHHDYDDPDSGLVFDTRCVSADLCERPLFVLLKAFGNLLPARARDASNAAVESGRTAASWTAIYPAEMNAHFLHHLVGVQFRWVDSLALHLDYDRSSKILSLFAFPSICAKQLQGRDGAIFAFSSTESHDAADPRGDEGDIAQLLKEVLLSFRLLFGQSPKSRKLFRRVFEPATAPFPRPDTLLPSLCSQKTLGIHALEWMPRDRRIYYAARDFPVLYGRVELLAKELSGVRPKSVGDLLRDRRDTLQFWTFWLVAIIGGLSIGLSTIQVVLQGIQLAREVGGT